MANRDEQLRIVISSASQDPGFKSLKPEAQDRIVSRLMQEKYGSIQKSEGLLSKVARDIQSVGDRFVNSATGGLYEGAGNLGNMVGGALTGTSNQPQLPVLAQPATPYGKFAGDISSAAGLVAGAPGKLGGMVAKKVIPQMAAQSGIQGFLAKSLGRGVEGAITGLMAPGDIKERFGNAATQAILNPAVSGALDPLIKPATGIINRVFKPGNILKNRPSFPQDILEKGLIGNEDQIIQKSGDLVESSENKIQQMISNQGVKANLGKMLDNLQTLKQNAIKNSDDLALQDIDRVEQMIMNRIDDVNVSESTQFARPNEYPVGMSGSRSVNIEKNVTSVPQPRGPLGEPIAPRKKISILEKTTDKSPSNIQGPKSSSTKTIKDPARQSSLEEANKLKRVLYKETPKKQFGEYTEDPYLTTALGLKNEIEQALPNMPIKQTNLDEALGTQAKRLMEKKQISNSGKGSISLKDLVIGGTGVAKGKVLEAGAFILLNKILQSTRARTGIANLLYNISKQSGNIGRGAGAYSTSSQKR